MRKYGLLAALVLVVGAAMPAEAHSNNHGKKNGHAPKRAPAVVTKHVAHHHVTPVAVRHVHAVPVRPVVHVHPAPVKVVTRTVPVYVPKPQPKPGLTIRINL